MERDLSSDIAAALAGTRALGEATAGAVRGFLNRLKGKCTPVDALVFGSRARGDYHAESDIDVAVILKGPPSDRYEVLLELSDVAYDVLLETSLRIQPLPLWTIELDRPELFSNPALIETIKRDGVRPGASGPLLCAWIRRDRRSRAAERFSRKAMPEARATVHNMRGLCSSLHSRSSRGGRAWRNLQDP